MSFALGAVVLAVLVVGVLFVVSKVIGNKRGDTSLGADLITYGLLAIFMGGLVWALFRLGRAAFPGETLVGMSQEDLAAALAGLIVSAPVVYILWRRQADERQENPQSVAWPVYLAFTDLIYLTWLMVYLIAILGALLGESAMPRMTDVLIIAGVFGFHEMAARADKPGGSIAEVYPLVGSGLGLIATATGVGWVLWWLFDEIYASFVPSAGDTQLALGVAFLIVGAAVWGFRWLATPWDGTPDVTRWTYLVIVLLWSLVTFLVTTTASGIIILLYVFDRPESAASHFEPLVGLLAVAVTSGLVWWHHRPKLGSTRTDALRFYEYAMAAIGLVAGITAITALVGIVFEGDNLVDDAAAGAVSAVVSGAVGGLVWWFFWTQAREAPRAEEAASLPRKLYVIGMAVLLGLTTAGAVLGILLFIFQAVLGLEVDGTVLATEITLAALAGAATYHLFGENKADGALRKGVETRPYTVTVICSHPGNLAGVLPKEATMRVIHRGDGIGSIEEEAALAIVEETRGNDSIVWVDESGYRVVPGLHS